MNTSGLVFKLNGMLCFEARSIIAGCRQIGVDTSSWENKVNSFTQRTGVDPSYGYVLCDEDTANQSETGLTLSMLNVSVLNGTLPKDPSGKTDVTIRIPSTLKDFNKLRISKIEKISPSSTDSKGVNLVKLVDSRYTLRCSLVHKRFNLAKSLEYNSSSGVYEFSYDNSTINIDTGSPYTWREVFNEIFQIPNENKLDQDDLQPSDYPPYTPQDIDFRYLTRRDALERLLQICNFTIAPKDDGDFKLVKADQENINLQDELKDYLKLFPLKNKRPKIKGKNHPRPTSFTFFRRQLDFQNQNVAEYDTEKSTVSGTPQSKADVSIWLPRYSVKGFSDSQLNPEDRASVATDDFLSKAGNYFNRFPPIEFTFNGLHDIKVSGHIEQVVWKMGKGTSRTIVSSVLPRKWSLLPQKVEDEKNAPLTIIVGKVVGVAGEERAVKIDDPTFTIQYQTLTHGSIPQETATNPITVANDLKLYYSVGELILAFTEDTSQSAIWHPDDSGTEDSNPIIHFELAEDMDVDDAYKKAYVLDKDNNRYQYDDGSGGMQDLQVIVLDRELQYQGYKEWDDPLYGDQKGYTGYAYLSEFWVVDENSGVQQAGAISAGIGAAIGTITGLSAGALAGLEAGVISAEIAQGGYTPAYEIITMEHSARFVEATMFESDLFDTYSVDSSIPVANPTNYWDGRAPKTESYLPEGFSFSDPPFIGVRFEDRQDIYSPPVPGDKIGIIWDERAKKYLLWKVANSIAMIPVLIKQTVLKASWDYGALKVIPTSATVHVWQDSSSDDTRTYNAITPKTMMALNYYHTDILVSSGKARHAYVLDGEIVIADCAEIDLNGQ